jgi:SpoVK/Ycf46/Vps4 family AAA+-type ATPase
MIAAPEIVSGMSGESEAKIRGLFNDAAAKVNLTLIGSENRSELILFISIGSQHNIYRRD